jgi:hypothetical protein
MGTTQIFFSTAHVSNRTPHRFKPYSDDDAPLVAENVYLHLYNNGSPDSSQAAYALHTAVAHLRMKDEQNFLSWVPFIHLGK